MMRNALLALLSIAAFAAEPDFRSVQKMAQKPSAQNEAPLASAFGEEALKKGTAVVTKGPEFVFGVRAASAPKITVDDAVPIPMTRVGKSDLYVYTGRYADATTHNFSYVIDGKPFGGVQNVAAWPAEAYEVEGVPKGKLTEKMVHTSKLYDGMQSDWWVYTPAAYNAQTPAAVMVWQDGEGLTRRESSRIQIMIDNLTYQKKIPVIVHVLISPGLIGQRRMRSVEYDSMDDTYGRFLRDEILPEVAKKWNIRSDSYSRAIGGSSSGGICAFNVAWRMPDQFSRVLSRVGSFTSIQWKQGEKDGGNVFPFLIRKTPQKKNIRVWLQDGYNDLENSHGSWPLQNLQMANSLKMMGYDYRLKWTTSYHGGGGKAEVADALVWLWRGYDPSKTSDTYVQDPAEKDKPEWRVRALSRTE